MSTLKLRAIGNSVGVVLPKELLAELNVAEGDTLSVVRTPDGIRLAKADPEFERQMETAREIMKRRYNVLRELAK
ncbi:MAG TPA: AbrB/MazE/SpoVT family DNA-binding domain-containing protein [Acetobacteraceae bacterium]|nr:AbrB/MazE/SpoVT family DNA-binding domain-containing protein [Acetobacteraceae bacterium]